jgi:hypothetical protein
MPYAHTSSEYTSAVGGTPQDLQNFGIIPVRSEKRTNSAGPLVYHEATYAVKKDFSEAVAVPQIGFNNNPEASRAGRQYTSALAIVIQCWLECRFGPANSLAIAAQNSTSAHSLAALGSTQRQSGKLDRNPC